MACLLVSISLPIPPCSSKTLIEEIHTRRTALGRLLSPATSRTGWEGVMASVRCLVRALAQAVPWGPLTVRRKFCFRRLVAVDSLPANETETSNEAYCSQLLK